MASFHRKTVDKTKEFVGVEEPYASVCCEDLEPRPRLPLPPPPPKADHWLPPYLLILFCGLAVSVSFICYLILNRIYRSLRNSRQRNHGDRIETREVFVDEDLDPVTHHPIWLINTIGLEQSVIESIHVFKYKRDDGLIEGTDCSVCLSEFQDDESLRLLPKCSHAFHVPCIDTWLRSHKNCPLCRAPIIKSISSAGTDATVDTNMMEPSTREETPGEASENVDHVERDWIVEVENNEQVQKTSPTLNETSSGVRVHSDFGDHHRVQGEESLPMRRSVSMDEYSASVVHFAVANIPLPDQERHLRHQIVGSKKPYSMPKSGHKRRGSSSSISICSRVMKSSSFGRSSRKASSFTKRSYSSSGKCSHNRSY